jgi:hypothetical protein
LVKGRGRLLAEWSELWLEYPGPSNHLLELELFRPSPALLQQRLAIAVRRAVIERSRAREWPLMS